MTISITDTQGSGTDSNTQSFTLSLGGAGVGTNKLLVGAGGRAQPTSTGKTVSGITLDGIVMTVCNDGVNNARVTSDDASGATMGAAIFELMASLLPDPTVASVTCVVTYTGGNTVSRSGAAIAIIPNGATKFVYHVAFDATDGGGTTPATTNFAINVASGGDLFGVAMSGVGNAASASYAWTGMTEAGDIQVGGENGRFTSAALSGGSFENGRAVSAVGSGATTTWFDLGSVGVSYADITGQPTSKRHGGVPFMAMPGRGNVWAPVFSPRMMIGPSSPIRRAA